MDYIETSFEEFGGREISLAAELLKLWSDDKISSVADQHFDGSTIKVGFNQSSGMVFLVDNEYNTLVKGRKNGNEMLVLFASCPECGHEGAEDDIEEFERHISKGCEGCTSTASLLKGEDS